jgi:hypothetical protein
MELTVTQRLTILLSALSKDGVNSYYLASFCISFLLYCTLDITIMTQSHTFFSWLGHQRVAVKTSGR